MRVFLSKAVRGKMEFTGTLKKADEHSIYLESDSEEIEIPLENISKAKYVIK